MKTPLLTIERVTPVKDGKQFKVWFGTVADDGTFQLVDVMIIDPLSAAIMLRMFEITLAVDPIPTD